MPARRGPGPHTAWVGVVIKLDDGTTHAVEFQASPNNIIFADIVLPSSNTFSKTFVKIEGKGHYWTEGENLGPDVRKQREIEQGQRAIEGEVL
jgi:hypothetical protein